MAPQSDELMTAALLGAAQRVGFRVAADSDRVVDETEYDILGHACFIDPMVEVGRMERIFVNECGVFVRGGCCAAGR